MKNHTTHDQIISVQPTPSFFTLSLRPQLFLWTIRHMVYASKWNIPVCPHVQKTFDLAGIPELPHMIDELMLAFAQHTLRPIEVAHPQCKELLFDERLLVDCLRLFQSRPGACGCRYFTNMIDPGGFDSVMPRLLSIAELMLSCHRMAPLFGNTDPEITTTLSTAIH